MPPRSSSQLFQSELYNSVFLMAIEDSFHSHINRRLARHHIALKQRGAILPRRRRCVRTDRPSFVLSTWRVIVSPCSRPRVTDLRAVRWARSPRLDSSASRRPFTPARTSAILAPYSEGRASMSDETQQATQGEMGDKPED